MDTITERRILNPEQCAPRVTFYFGEYMEQEFESFEAAALFYVLTCEWSQRAVQLWVDGELLDERMAIN